MSVLDQAASTVRTGRITSGLLDATFQPRVRNMSNPPFLYLHGAGGNATEAVGAAGLEGVRKLLRSLAVEGFNVTAPTITQLWGNALCQSRINDAVSWNRTNLGSTNDAPVLIGASHGAVCALRYISDNPGVVACAVLIIPAIDMENARDTNVLGLRSHIDAAWGVTYPTPLPAGINPAQNTAGYQETPVQIWYAPDDGVCPGPITETFGAAIGAEIHSVGNLGHTNSAIAAVDTAQVQSFIKANT